MRALLFVVVLFAGCVGRYVGIVQASHGREFRCNGRFVEVQERESEHFVSRGCGFEADWSCDHDQCSLRDSRAWGMGAQ